MVRRKPQAEYKHYNPLFPYKVEDYEVLLRKWPRPPFTGSWSILSGPMVQGQPPESTLLNEMYGWTNRLGTKMEVKKAKGLKGVCTKDANLFTSAKVPWWYLTPVEDPPVEDLPVEGPPVEGPPVDGPPVEGPPEEGPPVEGPPVEVHQ